jgi:HEAT repeat protein
MPRSCPVAATCVAFLALLASDLRAQEGVYFGPDTVLHAAPRRESGKPAQPMSSQPPEAADLDASRWETWWALNREEFLPVGGIREDRGPYPPPGTPVVAEDVGARILPPLKKALTSRDHGIRAAAAVAIGKCGGAEEVPLLKALLDDRDRGVVEAAVVGLALLRRPESEAHLVAFANDPGKPNKARCMAAAMLGVSGGDAARLALFERLSTPGGGKMATGREIGGFESARAFGAGLWAGVDRAGGDAANAAMAAGLLTRALDSPPTRDHEFGVVGLAALSKPRDPGSTPYVLGKLSAKRSDDRAAAAIAAGRVVRRDDADHVKRIVAALVKESDPYARRMMLVALGRIGGADAIAGLGAVERNFDRQDRAFQLLGYGLARAPEAAPMLRTMFETGGDQSLRGAAAIALGLLGDRESLPALAKHAANQRDPTFLAHLMWTFVVARDRSACETIEKVARNIKVADVQCATALALGLLGHSAAEPHLLEQLGSGSRVVRGAAATALGRMGDARMIEPLVKLLESDRETDLTRVSAAVALGELGRRDLAPELARLRIDAQQNVRHEALDALRNYL